MSAPSDRLRIEALTLDTVIGVNAWERRVRQRLLVDVELPVDARPAAASDAIENALDYGAVAARLREVAADCDHQLIEALAERLASTLLTAYGLPWVRLELAKPGAIPGAAPVRLCIERHAAGAG